MKSTADGEAEPGVDVDQTASVAKSNLFESCVSDALPASSPAVVSNECPSTLVEKMSSLKLDQCLPDSCDNSGVHEGTGVNDSRDSFSVAGEGVDVSASWQKPPSVGGAPEEHRAENSTGWLQPPSPVVAPEEQRPKNSKGCPEMPSSVGPDARAGESYRFVVLVSGFTSFCKIELPCLRVECDNSLILEFECYLGFSILTHNWACYSSEMKLPEASTRHAAFNRKVHEQ